MEEESGSTISQLIPQPASPNLKAFHELLQTLHSAYRNLEFVDRAPALVQMAATISLLQNELTNTDKSKRQELANNTEPVICAGCSDCFPTEARFNEHLSSCQGSAKSEVFESSVQSISQESNLRRSRRKRADPQRSGFLQETEDDELWKKDFAETDNQYRVSQADAPEVPYKVVRDFKGDERFQCDQCELKFSYYAALLRHCDTIHRICDANKKIQEINKKAVTCQQCGAVLSSKGALQAHMQKHSGAQPYCCEICKKRFSLKSNLLRHQRIHQGLKPYQCDICSKRFTEKRSVEVHRRIHTGEKPYSCEMCGMKFSQLGSWMLHKDKHSCKTTPGHECDVCGKVLAQKVGLYNHRRRHHDRLRNHACPSCNMSFFTAEELRLHTLTHTGQKPYLCSLCGKSFSRPQTFKNHMNQHSNESPFHCKHCPRTFTTSWAFSRHKRLHSPPHLEPDVLSTEDLVLQMVPREVITLYGSEGTPTNTDVAEAGPPVAVL